MPDTDSWMNGEDATTGDAGAPVKDFPLLPHLRWELEQVMTRVCPQDLSTAEIAALLAILRPAHSRVIGGPASRPGLRVLGVDGD